MSKWSEMGDELRTKLLLKSLPIGYKRFEKPEELDRIPNVTRLDHLFTICQLIARARKQGLTMGAKNTDPCYSHCARLHGLREVPSGMVQPVHGLKWVHSWEEERKRFQALPRIPPGGAIMYAPLSTITVDPDVVLIYGDPSQIIVIIQAMQRKKFERYEFACVGESSCADSLADCYLTGKPKVGLPGYGERDIAIVRDDEIALALPPAYLEQALEGFRELKLVYPFSPVGINFDMKPVLHRHYPDDPEFT
jgi:uncharacterized protein (DUF169 family)